MIPAFYGHREGGVDFADGADTFERLGFGMACQLVEVVSSSIDLPKIVLRRSGAMNGERMM